jgi:hypothetical protein
LDNLFLVRIIDAHGLKIHGGGVPEVFAKIPRGVKAFMKNCQGGPYISGFIAFLLTSFLKFAWEVYIYPHPFPPHPLRASMVLMKQKINK